MDERKLYGYVDGKRVRGDKSCEEIHTQHYMCNITNE